VYTLREVPGYVRRKNETIARPERTIFVGDPHFHQPTFEGCDQRREVAEGPTLGESGLFVTFGRIRKIRHGVPIGLFENLVPFGAEFLEGLSIDEFLEFGLELFLWGFFVAFGKYD
jgi:hypothetical protein